MPRHHGVVGTKLIFIIIIVDHKLLLFTLSDSNKVVVGNTRDVVGTGGSCYSGCAHEGWECEETEVCLGRGGELVEMSSVWRRHWCERDDEGVMCEGYRRLLGVGS